MQQVIKLKMGSSKKGPIVEVRVKKANGKAKHGNKKAKRQPPPKAKQKGKGNRKSSGGSKTVPMYLRSVLEPFAAPQGGSFPDYCVAPTIRRKVVDAYTPQVEVSSGNGVFVVRHLPYRQVEFGSVGVGTNTPAAIIGTGFSYGGAGSSAVYSSLFMSTMAARGRCLGFGVKITNAGAMTTETGSVHIAHYEDAYNYLTDSTALCPLTLSALEQLPTYTTCSVSSICSAPVIIRSFPVGQDALNFRAPEDLVAGAAAASATGDTSGALGWATIVVWMTGLKNTASVSSLRLEVVTHYELLANGRTAAAFYEATPSERPSAPQLDRVFAIAARTDHVKQSAGVSAYNRLISPSN